MTTDSFVFYNGYVYAVMDLCPRRTGRDSGICTAGAPGHQTCQDELIEMPPGWEVAKYSSSVHNQLFYDAGGYSGPGGWGYDTHVLVYAGGNRAYSGSAGTVSNCPTCLNQVGNSWQIPNQYCGYHSKVVMQRDCSTYSTAQPTSKPTKYPTPEPTTSAPTPKPSNAPTPRPTNSPTSTPTPEPSNSPTYLPSAPPTVATGTTMTASPTTSKAKVCMGNAIAKGRTQNFNACTVYSDLASCEAALQLCQEKKYSILLVYSPNGAPKPERKMIAVASFHDLRRQAQAAFTGTRTNAYFRYSLDALGVAGVDPSWKLDTAIKVQSQADFEAAVTAANGSPLAMEVV